MKRAIAMLTVAVLCVFVFAQNVFAGDKSISVLVLEAKEMLKDEHPEPIFKIVNSKRGNKRYFVGKETLRVVTDSDGALMVVRINMAYSPVIKKKKVIAKYQIGAVHPDGCVAEKIGGGGVNVNYRITCGGKDMLVLAGKDISVGQNGELVPMYGDAEPVYVPYSDALAKNEVIDAGRDYIKSQIAKAEEELRTQRVYSRATPGKLVADVFDGEILFRLSIIEHIDHEEFIANGVEYSVKKVLTQFGLNREDTFKYAVSHAGALCLMQIMPSTYAGIRKQYPEAKLPVSAKECSCGSHVGAIKAAYLVLDSKLGAMPDDFKRKFPDNAETYGIYLAAAYNGGQARATSLYRKSGRASFVLGEFIGNLFARFGLRKDREDLRVLRKETWIFIKKYSEVAEMEISTE